MVEMNIKSKFNFNSNQQLLTRYILILIVSFLVSAIISQIWWAENLYVIHAISETICIFIAIATFLIVWNTYEKNSNISYLIGLGFLAVAIFDLFHIYYFFYERVINQGNQGIDVKYWTAARLTEVIVLLVVSLKIEIFRINKWRGFLYTIAISLGISLTILYSLKNFQKSEINNSGNPYEIIVTFAIVAFALLSIYNIRKNLYDKSVVSYKHILMALLLIIPVQIWCALFKGESPFHNNYIHILKMIYYYFFYKAVFVSTINYSHNKLQIEHDKLEEKNTHITNLSKTLNDLLDALPIAIFMYDNNGRVKYMNKKFEIFSGYDRNTIKGLSTREFYNMVIEGGNGKKTIYERTLEDRKNMDRIIETFKTSKGKKVKVWATSHIMKSGVLILLKDVKKEQELENMQLQTQTILNSMEKLVMITDQDNKILMCNKRYEEVTGVSAKDIVGMEFRKHRRNIKMHLKGKNEKNNKDEMQNNTLEASFISKYGETKKLLYNVSTIQNVEGEIIGKIAVASDITNLAEQQEKMIQQEKLALLGQMGASIVHETRNYLTTIKGSCQLIDILTEETKIKNYTTKINKSIDEVNRIISEFLSLSKPREVQLEEVSIYDMVQSIKCIVETSSLLRGINISFYLSKDEEYLLCDESQIKQVVLNICKNAVDAMLNIENARLVIETGYDENTNEMFIKITDNGQGMSKETLKKIGTPFFTTKKTGTGLGLNVCYTIIKEHKGRIKVDSELGSGTTFKIILPCIQDDEEFEEVIS